MSYPKSATEAEKLGVPLFFTGEPCKKGHIDLRRWCRFEVEGRSYLGSKCETCRKKNRAQHRHKDTGAKLRNRINVVLRSRIKGSKHRSTKVSELLGCSIEDYMYYIEQQWQPGMTWDNWGVWHIDHIRPCKSFDLTDPVQVKQCFRYTNTRPLWATQNRNPGKIHE
jgi:hypothetical protein